MAKTYQHLTLDMIQERLGSGYYKSRRGALIAARNAVGLDAKSKKTALEVINGHFKNDAAPIKRKPSQAKKNLAALKNGDKFISLPFHVLFARCVGERRNEMVALLRGAANAGITLPDLLQDLEKA